jgi:signal transduction histidine kinase
MLFRPFVVLASVTVISLIAIAWISYDSARVMAGALDSVDHIESARRFAMYGPWAMCGIATIMLASTLAYVRATQARARKIRAELHHAIRQEHAARKGAEEADHKKDQFLATVSHELRTPLTSIIGWCGLLSDERAKQNLLDEGLASIAQAARVQSQLVEDLLDVSRIIAGKLEPHLADVNAVDVIENAIASVAPSARAKGITINNVVEGQPRTLRADAIRLEQVAWNLLSNAIKFTPENGSIEVALRWTESHLEITVADTGEGIGPDLLPYIFDPFRQGQSSGARKGGLGLGLSIVKSLVELHGGAVRAESAGTGAGATFIVELPVADVDSSIAEPPAIGRLFIARRPSTPGPAVSL